MQDANPQDLQGEWITAISKNDPQIVSNVNGEWSEGFPFPQESAPCLLNTLNIRDRDKLRQHRNRSIQSRRLQKQQRASERLVLTIYQSVGDSEAKSEKREAKGTTAVNTVIVVRQGR